MDVEALRKCSYNSFTKIGAIEMDEMSSLDLDTMLDWKFAELLINEGYGR